MARLMVGASPLLRRVRIPGEVAAICLVIVLADIVAGVVIPTFPLHARQLGIDLQTIGVLNGIGGLVGLFLALPIGVLSDRVGRRWVIIGGMVVFALALLCFAGARGVALLVLGRVLFGIAGVATFQIGAAHLGDVTAPGQRSMAFGLYATAMGFGFTVGPIVGGQLAQRGGTASAYLAGVGFALAGCALAVWLLPRPPARGGRSAARSLGGILAMVRRSDLALASLGNLLMSWTFNGAISTFFPLYGDALGLSAATIGGFFAIRALVSALGRLPNGLIARRLGNRAVMLTALGVNTLAMLALSRTAQPGLMVALLICEGLAFGAYLVSGQTFIADQTTAENRGTAVGLYAMAGSIGATAAPAGLGVVADRWGLAATFGSTGVLLAVGVLVIGAGMLRFKFVPQRER